jgi:hypothetical protein
MDIGMKGKLNLLLDEMNAMGSLEGRVIAGGRNRIH